MREELEECDKKQTHLAEASEQGNVSKRSVVLLVGGGGDDIL